MEKVIFQGAKEWGKENGWTKKHGFKNCPIAYYCLKSNKEYVVICSDNLKKELQKIPSDSFLGQKMKDITEYLDGHKISWEVKGVPSKL